MNSDLIKSSFGGSILVTLLYLVLFYPLVLIHKFNWYDLMLVSLSISPGIFIMIFLYNLDQEDKEPLWLLALCFICGAINLHLDVEILEFVFTFINLSNPFLQVGGEALSVAITEELLKFIVLILIIYPNKAFDEPFDGIVYAVFIGMGFATAVIMGYYIGIAKYRKKKQFFYIALSLFVPIFLHGIYDYFLYLNFAPGLWVGGILTLVLSLFFAKNAIVEHLDSSPFKKK